MSKCHCSHEHSQVRRLTIHSQYTCAIEGSLRVHVPVRLYELTLKHRLLDQLGGFSHLILEALDVMPDRGIEWVLERTALNPQQLHPIIRRLEGLGLVENFNLTARAKPLLKAKRLLHAQTKYLWLDGDYRRHSFCGVHTLETSELNDETQFVIRPWHRGEGKPRLWPSSDWGRIVSGRKTESGMFPSSICQWLSRVSTNVFETRNLSGQTGLCPYGWQRKYHATSVLLKLNSELTLCVMRDPTISRLLAPSCAFRLDSICLKARLSI